MELTGLDYVLDRGAIRQRDLTPRVTYDEQYVRSRYEGIDAQVRALSLRRLEVLEAFVPARGRLLDYGCGTGRFVEIARGRGWDARGYDLAGGTLDAAEALRPIWDVVTFFDSMEHLPDPAGMLACLAAPVVMISVPWCHHPRDRNWEWFLAWKHRRPGEHLWHFSASGLDEFMGTLGYASLMHSCFEDDFRPRYDPGLPNVLTAIYRLLAW